MTLAYYFGCGRDSGHFWWRPGDAPLPFYGPPRPDASGRPPGCPFGYEVDGGVQPGGYRGDEPTALRASYKSGLRDVEGPCRLQHRDGWTLIGWWDRSVDKRGACCSAFAMEGEHDFDAMVGGLRRHFPWVVARLTFELTLSPEPK